MITIIHLAADMLALGTGLMVVLWPKGTRTHKSWGYAYVITMTILNLTSFGIYGLFDGWGAFHYMALFSLATIMAGLIPAWGPRQKKNWIIWHNKMMCWSYVGLVMATGSHIMDGIVATALGWGLSKPLAHGLAITSGWVIPFALGMIFIERFNRRHIHPTLAKQQPSK